MAKYQQYEEYKESGIEWVEEIPKSWSSVSLRWISTIYSGGTPSKTNLSYWEDGTIPWLNSGTVNQGLIVDPSTYITNDALQNSSAKWIPKGSLVLALAGQGKTKGMVAQTGIDTTCNQSMAAIVFNEKKFARFIFWWLTSNYQNIRNMAGGDLRDGLNLEHLGSIQCPQPSIDEAIKITGFLDHETAQIDTLIEKQQTLIKLLKEKRQAVISHAVTKGLNPDAPMKNSGVEWLGEVPEHWEVSKLKYLISEPLQYGANEAAEDVDKTHPRFVRITDVLPNGNLKDDTFRSLPQDIAEPYMLMDGDVLLARSGGTVGKSFIYRDSWGKCCFAGYLIKAKIDENITPAEWFYLNTLTDFYWKWIESIQIQATIQNVSADKYNSFVIAVPPLEESYKIISHIKFNLEVFDTLVMKAEQAIQLMQERRTALISAAVTGKIDVRGWRVPE